MATLPEYSEPNDSLPGYSPGLNYYGLALTKTEFLTPYHSNTGSRAWKPVLLHLNSTQLNIYDLNVEKKLSNLIVCLYSHLNSLDELVMEMNQTYKKNTSFDTESTTSDDLNDIIAGDAYGGNSERSIIHSSKLSKLKLKLKHQRNQKTLSLIKNYYDLLKDNKFLFEPSESQEGYNNIKQYQGQLINSYSLAHLQLGEAPSLNQVISAMYKEENIYTQQNNSTLVKYKNVLRLRIEYKQILLQFWSFPAMNNWYRNLVIGRDLSFPLEMRNISRLKSIPSRNSRRANALLMATAAAADYGHISGLGEDAIPLGVFRSGNFISKEDREDAVVDDGEESVASISPSLFDRRGSVVTTDSNSSVASDFQSTTIFGFKFYSTESTYTTLEKQYISNCIPDLNSFDKWCGKLITISNVDHFVRDTNNPEIYISSATITGLVCSLDRNAHKMKNQGNTKTFLIHERGLFSIELNENNF
ncbi:uncharacterized protein J8A68_001943 [[Candida] subhashii]|uniref:Uncharacterized protein n=1 Tax=[Candida] subhashii TaxID=561895 RepID=A0A8J5UJF8_9ASCO|nr:uncharacterized protein J8A68_001943 [[Candida] subhashii]KAG7664533.1 hypothetical protein J8A68_001943 [[Candida] subhashii]